MSKVLVIHPMDPSTEFLKYSYEGKGYDVIRDGGIDREKLRKIMEEHDRIIMMGHGVPSGLFSISIGSNPYVIDKTFVDILKRKETMSVWCWSDEFFKENNIGHGEIHTGVIISEVGEQRMIFGKVYLNYKEILDNMIFFAKVLHDCIDMPPEEAVEYLRSHYNRNDAVSEYNRRQFKVI